MPNLKDSFLSGSNIEFIEGLYARFLENPSSVDPSWRDLFEQNRSDGKPIYVNGKNGHAKNGALEVPSAAALPLAPEAVGPMGLQAKVDQTIYAFRLRGHLLAQLDPLGRPRPKLEHASDVGMVDEGHFSSAELKETIDPNGVFPEGTVTVSALLARLRRTYCDHIGVEYMTLLDSDRRRWLMPRMEHCENQVVPPQEEQRRILEQLSYAEGFESFLHTKYVGVKRFSLDGGESLIPMLHAFLQEGSEMGVAEVVIGMAHRGRLNVLTNILGKSPDQIFSEFEGPADPKSYLNRGDVKYHQGFSSDYRTLSGKSLHLSLAFNPSHLEAVDPVVEGRVRAKQERLGDGEGSRVVPLLIHGDAAFSGQGVVPETLNLAELAGYKTGGTIHLVINNQLGFTTEPSDGRSSLYCTAVAQMLDIPIFHVNGDDPEACLHVMRLATRYRQTFKSDVVIDLVCFRRYGHNEGDEPSFTQPAMYELIKHHPSVRQLYAQQLIRTGRITAEEAESIRQNCIEVFQKAHQRVREHSQFKEPSALEGLWRTYRGGPDTEAPQAETGLESDRLSALLKKTIEVPPDFTAHPKILRLFEQRRSMAEGKLPLDWSAGEALAYASVLAEGFHVRLTGQDTERGTFSHRHAVLHDVKTDSAFIPLQHLSESQGDFHVYNSPLSEMGCLGFEFGYSLDCPDALVVWEAQFGDFSNGAQVIIDQFIVASEQKWRRLSGLTLLLPHGYEGMGPEHSSARLERFLGLCGTDNIQVCYPTTPGQIFHLLRRQVVRPYRKPLVIMSPKSLLRRPEATSALSELTTGRFQRLIPDPQVNPKEVKRLILCSGKVYFDLRGERDKKKDRAIALVRLEQLYPFPHEELRSLLTSLPQLKEVLWVQEEPRNQGAWSYVFPILSEAVLGRIASVGYVGRTESASPATGFHEAHVLEQQLIVEQAMSWGKKNGR